ncbi:MAG: uracil-DNA glycosylase [Hyphomicrobiaceae bacterium]|nr:uracil-DNA glycosylase [Hyphomicrobiaceae bacterium]
MFNVPQPKRSCRLCPRLVEFREECQRNHPEWFNGAVPSFGSPFARLLIVGLAPGMNGANRTGRPFTGDYAGDLLYKTLFDNGFAQGVYRAEPNDGFALVDCMVTNAVRCLPPQNKPIAAEINTCGTFLAAQISAMPYLKAILALGNIAHYATVVSLNHKRSEFKFGHGLCHNLTGNINLFDSYHCSRYNIYTGRLTATMFEDIFRTISKYLRS